MTNPPVIKCSDREDVCYYLLSYRHYVIISVPRLSVSFEIRWRERPLQFSSAILTPYDKARCFHPAENRSLFS